MAAGAVSFVLLALLGAAALFGVRRWRRRLPGARGGDAAERAGRALLERLRILGGPEDPSFVAEMLELFFSNSAEGIALLRRAATGQDSPSLKRVAHRLRGGAGNVGARGVVEICARLESLGGPDIAAATHLIDQLEQEIDRIRLGVQERMRSAPEASARPFP